MSKQCMFQQLHILPVEKSRLENEYLKLVQNLQNNQNRSAL